ncbi:MAG: hypothetical protein ACAH80_01995 [Alphaproteobacteria bacterium]
MKLQLLLPVVLAALLLAAPARADMAASFDMEELTRGYALPCDAQRAERRRNIQPPYFPGRPDSFKNDMAALVIYSPHLTAEQRQKAEQLFAGVPSYALPLVWRGGGVYVFTRRGIVEAVPALAVESEWFGDLGLYMEVDRRLYLPFEKGVGLKRQRNGDFAAERWVPTDRDQPRAINHETGHIIDAMLGRYSRGSRAADGRTRLSNRSDYMDAFNSDLARLTSQRRPIPIERIRKLGYYMPRSYKGFRLGIQEDQRARREVFAELWAEAHGHDKNKLSAAYPDTFKVVKALAEFLKTQDAVAPVKCEFN